ncbi:MAG: hypothetical protein RL030_2795 [Pseudomonadota bacterium]|jgi:hypothetical protein
MTALASHNHFTTSDRWPADQSTIKLLADAWIRIVAPPPRPRGLLEFCRTLRVKAVDPDTGEDRWEQFDPESHPGQFEILKAFVDGGFSELVVLGPVQDGKTYAVIVALILYCLIELRQSCGLMLPEQEKSEEVWLEKIVPVARQSGYGWIFPDEGRGAKSGAARFMVMKTGATQYLIGAGARNESAQASFSVRFMLVDERDKVRPNLIPLARARTSSYDLAGRFITTSTIGDDERSDILMAYEDSTKHRNVYQCPHCVAAGHELGGWQPFDFDLPAVGGHHPEPFSRFIFDSTSDDTARATARLRCIYDAAHLLTDAERKQALRRHRAIGAGQSVAADGTVTGPQPVNSRKGLRWVSLESPLKSMAKLAQDLRKALIQRDQFGNHVQIRQFYRDERVEGYVGDKDKRAVDITAAGLSEVSRRSDYDARQVPTWVEFLTVGQDVQLDRHYWLVEGHGPRGRRCVVDWGYEDCVPRDEHGNLSRPPAAEDHLAVLDRIEALCAAGWQVEGGDERLVPPIGAIDVNYQTGVLLSWIVGHPQWMPCIGVGGQRAIGMQRTSLKEGKSVLPIEVAQSLRGVLDIRQVKDALSQIAFIYRSQVQQGLHTALLANPGDAGGLTLPRGLRANHALLLHLSSRVWTRNEKSGTWYWREVRRRDDHLACLVIADAIARFWTVYQPWLAPAAPGAASAPRRPSPAQSSSTTPDGRPYLLSDR